MLAIVRREENGFNPNVQPSTLYTVFDGRADQHGLIYANDGSRSFQTHSVHQSILEQLIESNGISMNKFLQYK